MKNFIFSKKQKTNPKVFAWHSRSSSPAQAYFTVQPLVWPCVTSGPWLMLFFLPEMAFSSVLHWFSLYTFSSTWFK